MKPTCAPQFMRIADQIGIETRYSRGCLAGLTYCVVGSEGIVRPCAYMQEAAGDVRTQPFGEIWRTSPLFQKLRTQAYKAYVEPINSGEGIPLCKKASILGVSYVVMAISAFAVARPSVWVILGCVAVFLFWLIGFHVPTASAKGAE